ncbi:MAG: radical SAM protein [Sedimentisphaerales bacterium]|nr:radical SAM protein [Sedimentisphaerales bacterium]
MNPAAHIQVPRRAELARKAIRHCQLCPRNCGVDRVSGQKGYCKLDSSVRCYRDVLHWGEEKELNPSHQVYFAGCNLRCEFCSVAEWNEQPESAEIMDLERLIASIKRRKSSGAKNLNLLGGEPAVSIPGILELLGRLDASTLVVWNSNMYYNDIVDELMTGLMDICLADTKCGNNDCARRLLGCEDYMEIVKRNIINASQNCDVIVRHLLLPGHFDCCVRPILNWLSAELPSVKVSLRGNYVPPAQDGEAPLRYLQPDELEQAEHLAEEKGLTLIR